MISAPVDNDGTIDVSAGTLNAAGTFVNYDQINNRLTGGAYVVRNGSTFQFAAADVAQLRRHHARRHRLEVLGWFQDGLRNLNTIDATGKLALRNGRNFTRTGSFTNNGRIDLDDSVTFTTTANYTQGARGTLATDISGTVAGPATASSWSTTSRT